MLDTNVWLDWLVFEDAGVSHIKRAVSEGHAQIYADEACLNELARVLAYPLLGTALDLPVQGEHLATARTLVHLLDPNQASGYAHDLASMPVCRDPDDQKFLVLARDCGADALVTKDRALLELGRRRRRPLPFRIVAPCDLVV
ncbi:MAG TPA: putative toxin-antitoxin system toxin component, PIN family [Burkholderiales bacterium]|nr:putative toxin-antitoxin system toxin component, PIN family [Burkholderiales bacterium]